jgi:DNA integrity scanning protein DisA with diadenylate cyclase activity
MPLARQTIALLSSARQMMATLPAHAVLVLTETDMNWEAVRSYLGECKLLVAAEDIKLQSQLQRHPGLTLVKFDPAALTTAERISLAVLAAVRGDLLSQGDDVVVLYNGIEVNPESPEPIDSLSVIHLGEHLERLRASDLRALETQVPLDTLQAVVRLATSIGREGREGHPVGTLFVVGDTRKVLTMCRPINFNPFRGYSHAERDVKVRAVREQIKEIAQMDGAIVIRRDGVAVAAGLRIEAPASGIKLSKGLGMRHAAAAAISQATKAIAVCVSQSSGSVRIYQNGEMVLHIEPFKRPLIFGQVQMGNGPSASPPPPRASESKEGEE